MVETALQSQLLSSEALASPKTPHSHIGSLTRRIPRSRCARPLRAERPRQHPRRAEEQHALPQSWAAPLQAPRPPARTPRRVRAEPGVLPAPPLRAPNSSRVSSWDLPAAVPPAAAPRYRGCPCARLAGKREKAELLCVAFSRCWWISSTRVVPNPATPTQTNVTQLRV